MNLPDVNADVSCADVAAVLPFLPRLEALIPDGIWSKQPRISVEGHPEYILEDHHTEDMLEQLRIWSNEPGGCKVLLGRGEYNPIIWQFQRALYDHRFIRDYDWMTWQPQAVRIFENPDLLRRAQMRTCVKLLTLHIRRERFDDGHLSGMLRSRHITAILRRMGELASRRSEPFQCLIVPGQAKAHCQPGIPAFPLQSAEKR